MTRRKLTIGLVLVGLTAAGLGSSVMPASAQQRVMLVRLVTGDVVSFTLPDGAPCDASALPALPAGAVVVSCQDSPGKSLPGSACPARAASSPRRSPSPPAPPAQQQAGQPKPPVKSVSLSPSVRLRVLPRRPPERARLQPVAPTSCARTTASPRSTTRPSPSPIRPGRRSGCRTSSSRSSGSRRSCCRSTRRPAPSTGAVAGPGGDQRDRDRLRAQPQRLVRRRDGLDAVHAGVVGTYGVDANGDGKKDPYNPVDAIFAAARYLHAAGASKNLSQAIFAYNHADWYVQSVLLRAKLIGGHARRPRRLADRPHRGPLPRRRPRDLRRRPQRGARTSRVRSGNAAVAGQRQRRAALDQHLLARGRARDRGQRRRHPQGRTQQRARQLRRAPGRLRQHLHVLAPRPGRAVLPGAQSTQPAHAQDPVRGRAAARPTRRPATAPAPAATAPEARRPGRVGAGGARPLAPRQGAPVRASQPQQRLPGGRRPAAARHRHPGGRLRDLRRLHRQGARAAPLGRRAQGAEARRAGDRRHDHRARRQDRPAAGAARHVLDQARRPRRARRSTPSRSSTAGSCSRRRRSTAPRARTRSGAATPRTPPSARSC